MQAAAETVSVHEAADGLAFLPAQGPAGVSTAPAPTAGPSALDPPGEVQRPAQRPADRRKRVSECGAPPIMTRNVRPRVAKPVVLAPSTALRALAAPVRSTATRPGDILVQSAAVCLVGNACGRPDRDTRVTSADCYMRSRKCVGRTPVFGRGRTDGRDYRHPCALGLFELDILSILCFSL